MPEAIPFVLWAWVPVTLLLFWKLGPARGAAFSLIGGWLFLPTARFADSVAEVAFPFWIMPSCLPSADWTSKARLIGVALALGVMAFDPTAWRRLSFSMLDLPILGWCLVPLVSGLVNGVSPVVSIANLAYQTLAWGVPYAVGRLYFSDPPGLTILARAIIGGALIYVPFCLVENVTGPIFYRLAYGFHAYQRDGASRYLGFRPIVGLEHGNQLGTWMASATLVAAWLWRSGMLASFWRLPGSLVVSTLATVAILTQSAGAVILLVSGLVFLEILWRFDRKWPIVALLVLPMVFVVARAANLVDAKALVMRTGLGRSLADTTVKLDRQSLGWRLRIEERAGKVALQRPVLGWGRWDWWREASPNERPWGLFSLVMGMYGVAGLAALIGILALPLVVFLNLGPPRFWINPSRAPAAALAWSLALNDLDAILNSNLLLFYLAVAGGLIGLKTHAEAASAWIKRAQAGLK